MSLIEQAERGSSEAGRGRAGQPSRRPSRDGPQGPPVVLGVLLALWGAAWLLGELGVVRVAIGGLLAITLIGIGVLLIVEAHRRPHVELVVLGAVLTIGLAVAATVTDLTIDLRDTALPVGVSRVRASVGSGQLVVMVPPGVPVKVRGRAAVGDVRALGQRRGGVGVDVILTDQVTGGGFDVAARSLLLDLRVGTGGIEVQP
jgi:hypothetical protein